MFIWSLAALGNRFVMALVPFGRMGISSKLFGGRSVKHIFNFSRAKRKRIKKQHHSYRK
jgi:hypothetical protein